MPTKGSCFIRLFHWIYIVNGYIIKCELVGKIHAFICIYIESIYATNIDFKYMLQLLFLLI